MMIRKIKFYSWFYSQTYKRTLIPMRLIVPFMKWCKSLANNHLEKYREFYSKNPVYEGIEKKNVIVSLTSFPERINDVWKTIISLKSQKFLPEKIILWLSKEEFKGYKIPEFLEQMQDERFIIKFIDDNLRPHNKYYYAFLAYPNSTIITVDDDEYYHKDTLRYLIKKAEDNPNSIISNRVIKIKFKEDEILPYNEWQTRRIKAIDRGLFFLGVGAVLYPPKSIHQEIFNKEKILSLTPIADDIWLNAMARLKGTKIIPTGFKYRNLPTMTDTPTLEAINCGQEKNDIQIKNVRAYLNNKYGKDIFSIDNI